MADDTSRTGVTYATQTVLEYLQRTHVPHDAALQRAFDAPKTAGIPAIQVGPSEGKLLFVLARMIGAKKAVEVGTLAGYSGIHLARGLGEGGRLWSLELDPKHAQLARDNFAAASLGAVVTVVEGSAVDTLRSIEANAPFDLVFVDADKGSYDQYGRWAAKHLRRGGVLLGDNAFYFGKLTEDSEPAAAMRRFHEESREHFDTVCAPTPDGMLIAVKR